MPKPDTTTKLMSLLDKYSAQRSLDSSPVSSPIGRMSPIAAMSSIITRLESKQKLDESIFSSLCEFTKTLLPEDTTELSVGSPSQVHSGLTQVEKNITQSIFIANYNNRHYASFMDEAKKLERYLKKIDFKEFINNHTFCDQNEALLENLHKAPIATIIIFIKMSTHSYWSDSLLMQEILKSDPYEMYQNFLNDKIGKHKLSNIRHSYS